MTAGEENEGPERPPSPNMPWPKLDGPFGYEVESSIDSDSDFEEPFANYYPERSEDSDSDEETNAPSPGPRDNIYQLPQIENMTISNMTIQGTSQNSGLNYSINVEPEQWDNIFEDDDDLVASSPVNEEEYAAMEQLILEGDNEEESEEEPFPELILYNLDDVSPEERKLNLTEEQLRQRQEDKYREDLRNFFQKHEDRVKHKLNKAILKKKFLEMKKRRDKALRRNAILRNIGALSSRSYEPMQQHFEPAPRDGDIEQFVSRIRVAQTGQAPIDEGDIDFVQIV